MNVNSSNTVNFSAYYQNYSDKAWTYLSKRIKEDKSFGKAGIKQLNAIQGSDHIDVTILRDGFTAEACGGEDNVYIRVSNRNLDLKHQKNKYQENGDSLTETEETNRQIVKEFAITDLTKPETWAKLAECVIKVRDNTV